MSATWAICLTVVALSWVAMAYAAGTYLRRLREARERLHRYRVATTTAHRWLGPVHGAGETALWVAQVGEGKRGCDIEQFREGLIRHLQAEVQDAWHAGLDEGRAQGRGDHAHQPQSAPEATPVTTEELRAPVPPLRGPGHWMED